MNMKFVILMASVWAILVGLLLLTSCSSPAGSEVMQIPPQPQNEIHDINYGHLQIVRLNDGTRCAVVYRDGVGVDCDWARNDVTYNPEAAP